MPMGLLIKITIVKSAQFSLKKKIGKRACLIRQDNDDRIVINKANYKIGKSAEMCDYAITDNKTISRVHAEILLKNNQVYVVDKKSTNKTYVNGNLVQSEVPTLIKNGDEIKFSNVCFLLSIE